MYERRKEIKDPRIAEGNKVFYCENRGYDSPDRWHEAIIGNQKPKEFGSREREKAILYASMTPCVDSLKVMLFASKEEACKK